MKDIKNVVSLFDGISCARVALERAKCPVEAYYASEIDKYAIEISKKNWPEIIQLGDIKKIKISKPLKWYGIDLLIGGSPCQDLSIAKKDRKGLDGSRSGLFYEYVRILNEVKPKFFILENVNSMPKEAKETITKELFGIEPIMINAALVSAQNRKRLFWVGKRVGDKYEQVKIELPEDKGILLKDILETEVGEPYMVKNIGKTLVRKIDKSHTLMARDYKGFGNQEMTGIVRVGKIGNGGQGDRIYSPDGKSVALSANGGGRGAKTRLYHIPHGYKKEKIEEVDKYPTLHAQSPASNHLLVEPVALRNRGKGKKPEYNGTDKANSMTTVQTDSMVQVENTIRKLTPIECERLQGLPDNYTDCVSNTQRYKACGNAFNVDVVAHIIKQLK